VSILHHRRHELQKHNVGAHIPLVADVILSPPSSATKYGLDRTHEALVEPPEVEGNTLVFELQSPDAEKRTHVTDSGQEGRH
jgi:hypothetical protein